MVARPSWKAHLRLSLVSIPVAGYTAHETAQDVPLHQIHKTCYSRIRYKKTCPIHGEVPKDEIVSGYEFAKDQYVEIEPEELDKLRSESDKAISIDAFVSPDAVDPAYFSGQTYYLLPEGAVGNKPYLLLHQGMVEQKKHAIARAVFRHREQIVLLRPKGRLIVMEVLLLSAEHVDQFDLLAAAIAFGQFLLKCLGVLDLIKAATPKKFDLATYKDKYRDELAALIDAKIKGKEIVTPPAAEGPHIINLMDALKKSLAMQGEATAADEKPPRKVARSAAKRQRERKRKTVVRRLRFATAPL